MNLSTLFAYLLYVTAPVVTALLALGLTYLVWVAAKHIRHKTVQNLLWMARDMLMAAMQETWQTYTADLKAAAADGKLTPEEKAEAKRRALEGFLARLGRDGQKQLEKILGDLQAWASREIEALMPQLKAQVGETSPPKAQPSASA